MVRDIYTLTVLRTTDTARKFINLWADGFSPAASEYEFPQYAENPTATYSSPLELIETLAKAASEPHAIYWSNP